MELDRGTIVVTKDGHIGRVQKVLTENLRTVNFFDPSVERFLIRDFQVRQLKEGDERDAYTLKKQAVEHNRKLEALMNR